MTTEPGSERRSADEERARSGAEERSSRRKDKALGRYGALERVQAYMIARQLSRLAWDDTTPLVKDLRLAEQALKAMPKPKTLGGMNPFAGDDMWR